MVEEFMFGGNVVGIQNRFDKKVLCRTLQVVSENLTQRRRGFESKQMKNDKGDWNNLSADTKL